ncbi:hypothetical protein KKG51_00970, partial [Patescibacteria group bacterium]|nr:hypothetical protein [Patescibacteria group bacterium]
MGKNILKNVLLFLVIFLTLNLIFKSCAGEKEIPAEEQGTIGIQMTNTEYAQGKVVAVDLRNNTDKEITIKNDCPGEPLNVFRYSKGSWEQLSEAPEISCEDQKDYIIASEEKKRIEYTSWNYALFANTGRYKVTLDYEDKTFESNEFTIEEPGVLRLLWTRMLYQPIYNSLVFLADALGKSL